MSAPPIPVNQFAERCKVSRITIDQVAPRGTISVTEPRSEASGTKSHEQDNP